MPTASPIDISSENSRTTVQNVPWLDVANSIIPIISAIPTGSFAPDSASRIVPVRPPISRLPSTENITAGSVGDDAAPLDRPDREPVAERRDEVGEDGCGEQEERRARDREALAEPRRADCEREARGHDQHDGAEIGDLAHPQSLECGARAGLFGRRGGGSALTLL